MAEAFMGAGVRVSFETDAVAPRLSVAPDLPGGDAKDVCPFDVFGLRPAGPEAGNKLSEIWLPQFGRARLGALRLEGASCLQPTRPIGPRWAAYGSSITQCRGASGPLETGPALVARAQGYDLLSLGFGAECHLDLDVARYIAGVRADLVTLCLGVNVYGQATLSARSLGPTIENFVRTVRAGVPDASIVVISPLASPDREDLPNALGMTSAEVRGAWQYRSAAAASRSCPSAGRWTAAAGSGRLRCLGTRSAPECERVPTARRQGGPRWCRPACGRLLPRVPPTARGIGRSRPPAAWGPPRGRSARAPWRAQMAPRWLGV